MKKSPHTDPPRERLLQAAAELFYNEGIRGVGVEAIAARAHTTKMAIYRLFESKDALVTEWLRGVSRDYASVFDDLALAFPNEPRAQLLGWIHFVIDNLYNVSHRGCPFVNSIAELPERSHPARRLIETHKMWQAKQVEKLCAESGIADPSLTAAELILLLEGGQIVALNRGIANVGEILLKLADDLVDRAVPSARKRPRLAARESRAAKRLTS